MKEILGLANLIGSEGTENLRTVYQCRMEPKLCGEKAEKLTSGSETDRFVGSYKTYRFDLVTGLHDCRLVISPTKTGWPGGGYDLVWQDAVTEEKLYEGLGQISDDTLTAFIWK